MFSLKMDCFKSASTLLISFILTLSHYVSEATHIRAGEITAVRRGQSLTYVFTITGYRDTGSQIKFGGGTLRLGDGTVVNGPFNTGNGVEIGNKIEKVTFTYTPYLPCFQRERLCGELRRRFQKCRYYQHG